MDIRSMDVGVSGTKDIGENRDSNFFPDIRDLKSKIERLRRRNEEHLAENSAISSTICDTKDKLVDIDACVQLARDMIHYPDFSFCQSDLETKATEDEGSRTESREERLEQLEKSIHDFLESASGNYKLKMRVDIADASRVYPKNKVLDDIIDMLSPSLYPSQAVAQSRITIVLYTVDLKRPRHQENSEIRFVNHSTHRCNFHHWRRDHTEENHFFFTVYAGGNDAPWPVVDHVVVCALHHANETVLYHQTMVRRVNNVAYTFNTTFHVGSDNLLDGQFKCKNNKLKLALIANKVG